MFLLVLIQLQGGDSCPCPTSARPVKMITKLFTLILVKIAISQGLAPTEIDALPVVIIDILLASK